MIVAQSMLILGLLINRIHRKRAEAPLHDMTGRLLESQDDERRQIARDLHDGTGQHLSGMALTIGQVLADLPPDTTICESSWRIPTRCQPTGVERSSDGLLCFTPRTRWSRAGLRTSVVLGRTAEADRHPHRLRRTGTSQASRA